MIFVTHSTSCQFEYFISIVFCFIQLMFHSSDFQIVEIVHVYPLFFKNWTMVAANHYSCTCVQLCHDLKCLWLLTYISPIYITLCALTLWPLNYSWCKSFLVSSYAMPWSASDCWHIALISARFHQCVLQLKSWKSKTQGGKCRYQDPNKAIAYHGPTMARWGYYLKAIWQYSMWQYKGNAGNVA